MKLRLTPLNIVTAFALALLIVLLVQPKPAAGQHIDVSALHQLLLAALIVVTFVSDLIFRFTLKQLKRIWIVELIFIAIAVILFLLLQK
jgi:hypothetical protein